MRARFSRENCSQNTNIAEYLRNQALRLHQKCGSMKEDANEREWRSKNEKRHPPLVNSCGKIAGRKKLEINQRN